MKQNFLFSILLLFPTLIFSQNETDLSKKDSLIINFAEEIENAFYEEVPTFLLDNFNEELFLSYFIIEDENKELSILNEEYRSGIGLIPEDIHKQVYSNIKLGGYYNMINFSEDFDGNYYLRFRFFSSDGGLNYHEYFIPYQEDGKIEISDIWVLLSGEFLSKTIGQIYLGQVSEQVTDQAFLDKIAENEQMDFDVLMETIALKTAFDAGDIKKAKKILKEKFSTTDQQLVNLLKLQIYDVDEPEYLATIEALEDDKNLLATNSLLKIDKHILNEEYDLAIQAIDNVSEYTSDDFLDMHRSQVYLLGGYVDLSQHYGEQFHDNYPTTPEGYDILFDVYSTQKNYSLFIYELERLEESNEYEMEVVIESLEESYPDVITSEEYKAWKASRLN